MKSGAVVAVAVFLASCGGSPSAPSPVPPPAQIPDVLGRWQGAWVVTSCAGSAVPGCERLRPGPFELRVFEQSGPAVVVTLSIANAFALNAFDRAEFLGVSGQIATNGSFTLPSAAAGFVYYRESQANASRGIPATLDSWQATVNGAKISGSFRFSARLEDRNITIAGTLEDVSRQAAP